MQKKQKYSQNQLFKCCCCSSAKEDWRLEIHKVQTCSASLISICTNTCDSWHRQQSGELRQRLQATGNRRSCDWVEGRPLCSSTPSLVQDKRQQSVPEETRSSYKHPNPAAVGFPTIHLETVWRFSARQSPASSGVPSFFLCNVTAHS